MTQFPSEYITSLKNPKIQFVRDLLSSRKSREEQKACVIEGVRLAEEAVNAGTVVQMVIYSDNLSTRGLELVSSVNASKVPLIKVPTDLMAKISDTETGQGLLLVVEPIRKTLSTKLDFVLILDEIKDPGNMGTILRTAAAAGVQLVVTTPGCVDVYSPKVLRAGMGAHFTLPIVTQTWVEIANFWLVQPGSPGLYLAESSQGKKIWDIDLTRPMGIIIGGEANGASEEAKKLATEFVTIPMPGKSESLNAAIAAGIFLFEVVRQRSA
jgi:RNA methyltransferase, TrmH family